MEIKELNLETSRKTPQSIFLGKGLIRKINDPLLDLIKELKDNFAWM